jgi:hypothetical protein
MQATPVAFRRLCELQQEMVSRLAALRSQLAQQLLAHINEPLLMKWVGHIQETFRNILARGINTASSSAWRLPPLTTHPRVVLFLNIQGTFREHSWNIQGIFRGGLQLAQQLLAHITEPLLMKWVRFSLNLLLSVYTLYDNDCPYTSVRFLNELLSVCTLTVTVRTLVYCSVHELLSVYTLTITVRTLVYCSIHELLSVYTLTVIAVNCSLH